MNYDKLRRFCPIGAVLILLAIFSFPACQGELPQVPANKEFTRGKMERLGDLLRPNLLQNYQILPQSPPYDTSVYWYVQTLYNQATNNMHRDIQSAPGNRWDKDRLWKVYIINDNSLQHTFTLPGGDLFISTGMLRSLQNENELYYLLTFEAGLMHEGHLLDRLILEYNALTINNIIEGNAGANEITANTLSNNLPQLDFDEETVKKNDKKTVRSVCETSILDPTGITPYLTTPETEDAEWLQTRPTYGNRVDAVTSMLQPGCGKDVGTQNYERFVLKVLN